MPASRRAHRAVHRAVRGGRLAPVTSQHCAECGQGAAVYHHNSYAPEAWLHVVALCPACHGRLHPRPQHELHPRVQVAIRIDPNLYALARRAAANEGVSVNEWIVRAMRERVERGGQ